jgi:hypothetical protein
MDIEPQTTAEQADLLPTAPQQDCFATLVATDGRLLRLDPIPGGGLVLNIAERKPVVLDRFQALAFRQAVAAMEAG